MVQSGTSNGHAIRPAPSPSIPTVSNVASPDTSHETVAFGAVPVVIAVIAVIAAIVGVVATVDDDDHRVHGPERRHDDDARVRVLAPAITAVAVRPHRVRVPVRIRMVAGAGKMVDRDRAPVRAAAAVMAATSTNRAPLHLLLSPRTMHLHPELQPQPLLHPPP